MRVSRGVLDVRHVTDFRQPFLKFSNLGAQASHLAHCIIVIQCIVLQTHPNPPYLITEETMFDGKRCIALDLEFLLKSTRHQEVRIGLRQPESWRVIARALRQWRDSDPIVKQEVLQSSFRIGTFGDVGCCASTAVVKRIASKRERASDPKILDVQNDDR